MRIVIITVNNPDGRRAMATDFATASHPDLSNIVRGSQPKTSFLGDCRMTDTPTRPAAGQPVRASLAHFLRHGWPLLLIVLSGVAAAATVLNLTVFAN